MNSPRRLLVIIPDRLSDLVNKGEITERYYNPGDLFEEVHILMINDDQPDAGEVQKTVGRARLFFHNLPIPSLAGTLGWQFPLLKKWVDSGVALAQQIKPLLIRAHGNFYNGYLAAQIKKRLGIPLVVSLHINPDVDLRGRLPWYPHWKSRLYCERMKGFERETLQAADWTLPVYEPIRGYAERNGAKRIRVCYNVLNPKHLRKKATYTLHTPPRIISVGRQFAEKNPDNLIRAIALLPDVELTLVGDGPYHSSLQQVVRECGVEKRVIFHKAISNDRLCSSLQNFDIFATHSEYWEISKSVLEALLTGLPTVLNRRRGDPVPELNGGFLLLVDNTPEGYRQAFTRLIDDHAFREQLGRRAYTHAQERWSPDKTESVFAEIYTQLINA